MSNYLRGITGCDAPCDPAESVDWQSRALAVYVRVEELEHQLQDVRSIATNALDELRAAQSAADLARKIGETWTSVTLQTKRRVRTGCNLSRFSDLLDQAAALGKAGG